MEDEEPKLFNLLEYLEHHYYEDDFLKNSTKPQSISRFTTPRPTHSLMTNSPHDTADCVGNNEL